MNGQFCSFCKAEKTPELKMIGDKNNDDGELICINCIKKAKKALDISDQIGNNKKIIKPRCFNVV